MRSSRLPLLLAAGVLVTSACGGDAPATLDATLAEDLATRADALAAGLEAGDGCAAIETAGELVSLTAARRDAGEIPEELAGEVIATTRDTVRGLTCDPAPAPEPAAPPAGGGEDEGEGKGEGKGEDEGKGKDEGKGEGKEKDDGEDGDD